MGRATARLALLLLLLTTLWPRIADAQFDARKPEEVGLAILPFEPERTEDKSVAFLLEDYLQAKLPRLTKHPVFTGRDLVQAVPSGNEACLDDPFCVRLLGGQFNVSLVTRVQMFRTGEEITLEVAFYTTGNGLLIGRENTGFATGEEKAMVDAFNGWFQLYFDTSLRVAPENRAGEGGLLGGGEKSEEQEERREDYERGRTKKVYSRRTDYGNQPDDVEFDREDPTGDLRALVGDDDDDQESGKRRGGRRAETEYDVQDDDLDLDDPYADEDDPYADEDDPYADEDDPYSDPGDKPGRKTRPKAGDDGIDLDARERRGDSVASYSDAQRAGYSAREYKRYTASGTTLETYAEHRWDMKGRFYLRAGGYYGGGWLTRRFATVVFVRPGGVKTDEYAWERLGPGKYGNPGGSIGFGFAPIGLLAVEVDLGLIYAQQDLRREYDSNDIGTNIPQYPQTKDTAHFVADVRARFFVPALKRVKFTPGLGATIIVMQGFQIAAEEPLNYTSRPTTGVFGITPLVGLVLSPTPFLSLAIDAQPTIYLTQGAANYEEHMLFNGETEPRLPESDKQPPIEGVPLMVRGGVTAMIMF
jgi:hypothetical protein